MNVLTHWTEQDLTQQARKGRLAPAFDVDDTLQTIGDLIDGDQHPIVTGASGVGKTAVVHELVRRVHAGTGPQRLAGRRILQISLRKRICTMEHRHEIYNELQKLIDALRKMKRPPALFVRDMDLVEQLDLEGPFATLACLDDLPIIGEGTDVAINAMFECEPSLQHRFTPVHLDEPQFERARRILRGWSQHQLRTRDVRFSASAIEQAVALSHRFLTRTRFPRKAIDLLEQAAVCAGSGQKVSAEQVIERLSTRYRIPRVLVDPSQPLDLERVRSRFASAVVGQPRAVDSIVDTISVLKAGLTDLRRPLAALLFVGPTGVGKTLVAQLLAETLFGRRDRLIRINMADHSSAGAATELFGAPAGQTAAARRGLLADRLAGHAIGVLLLDEFEKAHTDVHDRFLQLIDEGEFIDGDGETVSCRSTAIVATSNAGYGYSEPQRFGFTGPRELDVAHGTVPALERYFRYELLNRFDRVVHFAPLSRSDVRQITLGELRRLQGRIGLSQRSLGLEIHRQALDWLVQRGFDPHRGARFVRRAIEQHATTAIARTLSLRYPEAGSRIRLQLCGDKLVARIVPRHTSVATVQSPEPAVRSPKQVRLQASQRLVARERSRELVSAGSL